MSTKRKDTSSEQRDESKQDTNEEQNCEQPKAKHIRFNENDDD